MSWAASFAPLREKNFAWYFASRFVNTLGSMMANVALAFAVLDIGGSASALGQVLAAHMAPMVLLLLYGGVVADRLPRHLVIQASNIGSAVTQGLIAFLVISGQAELWMLIVLAVVHGIISGLGFPAMASVVPNLVPRAQLQPANALLSLTRGGLTVVGPTLGALLVVTVGSGWALALFSTGLFFFVIRILQINPFTFGQRIWLFLCLIALAAFCAWLVVDYRRIAPDVYKQVAERKQIKEVVKTLEKHKGASTTAVPVGGRPVKRKRR